MIIPILECSLDLITGWIINKNDPMLFPGFSCYAMKKIPTNSCLMKELSLRQKKIGWWMYGHIDGWLVGWLFHFDKRILIRM
jgi:hypothetical protein